jgi:hypothetical protein
MPTVKSLLPSNRQKIPLANLAVGLHPDEVRRMLQVASEKGLVRLAGQKAEIEKNGIDAAALGNVRSQWMDVTPAMAKRWLENNFRNRPLDEDVVHAYARDMINRVWVPTHQGIAFNDRDELIDGQHRLHAIATAAKKTIRMMVTFGLPSEIEGAEMTTMDAVDRGRTRSVGDQLKIQHGMKNGSIISQVCASMASLCYGLRTRRLSVGQTLDIYRAFQGATDWVIVHRSRENGLRGAGVLTAFAFALALDGDFFARHDTCPVAKMYERLIEGEELKEGMPITHLRAFLTSDEAVFLSRSTNRGVAELALQAIFLEAKGRKIEKLEMALDGADHFKSRQKERVAKIAGMFQLPDAKGKSI